MAINSKYRINKILLATVNIANNAASYNITGLDLTSYNNLIIEMVSIQFAVGASVLLNSKMIRDLNQKNASTSLCNIDLNNGQLFSLSSIDAAAGSTVATHNITTVTKSTNSLNFTHNATGNFVAGTINIYGYK